MITIYGMKSCPDCVWVYAQIKGREAEFTTVDIGEHVKNLKAFLKIRDNNPVFDDCKANGYAGIPCFVFADGKVSLNPEDAGLTPRPEIAPAGDACRLDGTGC